MIAPDDPRHGTYAGYNAGCHNECCTTAARNYQKRRVLEGRPRKVPSVGLVRRVQALACLGWSQYDIAVELGTSREAVRQWTLHELIHRTTHDRMAEVYERLCMTFPLEDTAIRRQMVGRTRARARRHGWAPPLAWDDIDDPNERPSTGYRHDEDAVDEAAVERALGGDFAAATTQADRHEVIQRWEGSLADLGRQSGWNVWRYLKRVA